MLARPANVTTEQEPTAAAVAVVEALPVAVLVPDMERRDVGVADIVAVGDGEGGAGQFTARRRWLPVSLTMIKPVRGLNAMPCGLFM